MSHERGRVLFDQIESFGKRRTEPRNQETYIRYTLYAVCVNPAWVVLLPEGTPLQLNCIMWMAKKDFAKIEELLVEQF